MTLNSTGNRFIENVFVFLIYSFLILLLIFTTKTVYAGFQLVDDHILIGYNNRLAHDSFFSFLSAEIKNEFYLRFRPLSIFNYIVIAKWIYPDFFMLALVIAFQGIVSCFFFYRFARQLKCSFLVSFLFPLFIMCGNQGAILWRNCVNETLGMLLLSISLFFLGKTFTSKKFYNRNIVFFSFFLILSTLTKESFIILVPAIIFLKIWQDSLQAHISFLHSLKANLKLTIFFAAIVITEILIIYYYKSISNHFLDYVAIDKETFRPGNLFTSLYRLTITKGYLIIIFPAMSLIFLRSRLIYTWKKDLRDFIFPLIILFLLVIIPQVLLYSKSLIFERYLLPGTLGCAIVIILLHNYIQKNKVKLSFLHNFFIPICGLLLCLQTYLMVKGAKLYAAAGFETRDMLETIIQNTKIYDTILVVATPLGQSDKAISVKKYLNAPIGGNRKNVFIEPVFDSTINYDPVKNAVINNFAVLTKGIRYKDISNQKNINCFLFFEYTREEFIKRYSDIDISQHRKMMTGSFTIFLK